MTPVTETRQSLADRLAKLRELMLFIRHNGVLSLVSSEDFRLIRSTDSSSRTRPAAACLRTPRRSRRHSSCGITRTASWSELPRL